MARQRLYGWQGCDDQLERFGARSGAERGCRQERLVGRALGSKLVWPVRFSKTVGIVEQRWLRLTGYARHWTVDLISGASMEIGPVVIIWELGEYWFGGDQK